MRPRLSFSRQRTRASSTIQICREQIWTTEGRPQGAPQGWGASTTAMLSVAGTRWREKSCAIFASPGEKYGLNSRTGVNDSSYRPSPVLVPSTRPGRRRAIRQLRGIQTPLPPSRRFRPSPQACRQSGRATRQSRPPCRWQK